MFAFVNGIVYAADNGIIPWITENESSTVAVQITAGVGETVTDAHVVLQYNLQISVGNHSRLVNMVGTVDAQLDGGVLDATLLQIEIDADALYTPIENVPGPLTPDPEPNEPVPVNPDPADRTWDGQEEPWWDDYVADQNDPLERYLAPEDRFRDPNS